MFSGCCHESLPTKDGERERESSSSPWTCCHYQDFIDRASEISSTDRALTEGMLTIVAISLPLWPLQKSDGPWEITITVKLNSRLQLQPLSRYGLTSWTKAANNALRCSWWPEVSFPMPVCKNHQEQVVIDLTSFKTVMMLLLSPQMCL